MQEAGLPGERARHRDFALLHRQPDHPAGDRREEPGLGQVVLALPAERGAGLVQPGAWVACRSPRRRRSAWTAPARPLRAAIRFGLVFCMFERRSSCRLAWSRLACAWISEAWLEATSALAPAHHRLVLRRVDLEQELALLHQVALLHRDLDDAAGDVGADVHLGLGLDLAAGGDGGDQVASADTASSGPRCRLPFLAAVGRTPPPPATSDPENSPRVHLARRDMCDPRLAKGAARPRTPAPRWPCGRRRRRSRSRLRPGGSRSARRTPRARCPLPSR